MREDTIEHSAFSSTDDEPAAPASTPAPGLLEPTDLRSRVLAFERGLLVSALEATGGHQRRAAAMLGLLPTTFHEKLKRHGLLR